MAIDAQKPGKSLEQLIATLEKALADDDNIVIEAPKRLPDRTTGNLREHDVILTIQQAHHAVLVAIECKDHSRPVGVDIVEGFHAKCQDTGIGQGVIVSTSGFYNSARKKADHYGIRCLDIEEVEEFPWLKIPGVTVTTRTLISNNWMFFPENEETASRENMELIKTDGEPIGREVLFANAQRFLGELIGPEVEPVENAEFVVKVGCDGMLIRNNETGDITAIKYAVVKLVYSITNRVSPFQLISYEDKEIGGLAEAAVANIDVGEHKANLMIVFGAEGDDGKVLVQKT